ncbi:hypothetical protein [Sulfurihydrogenibium sp.]|uniref:hypothetical protein n=1 Tax=Sulfurihydrogenibium sp. TaxID=2053621 RepID=UPI00262E3139|nr:hypothetical protein [Sulfurihydrogenibium sp.]
MNNEKGFSLITVLILSAVVFVLGSAAVYVSQYGYILVSSDVKYKTAEKRADYGIMKVFNDMNNQQLNCGDSKNYADGVVVYTVKAGSSCFIKSVGTFAGATVSKIAVISTQSTSTKYATVVMCNLSNMKLDGSSSIESCESSCITPALITGNDYTNRLNNISLNNTCKNNNGGLTAYNMDPYKYDPNLCQQSLLSTYFNGLPDRNALFNKMTQLYGVAFDNGKPTGLTTNGASLTLTDQTNPSNLQNNTYDLCNFGQNINLETVTGSGNTLTASSCYNISGVNIQVKPTFTWDGSKYKVNFVNCNNNSNLSTIYCKNVDLGQNTTLNLGSNFSGGGALAANEVNFTGDVSPSSSLTLVARNNANMTTNKVNVSNVNIFAQNYNISANNLTVENSLIFGGGGGQNININLDSNSKLGTPDNPVLIISDNNINIQRNGNAEINGIVYATSNNNNLNIGSGNGNFNINGMLVSEGQNNNINISGNFTISFDPIVITNVANKFNNLLKPPTCGTVTNLRYSDIITKQTLY